MSLTEEETILPLYPILLPFLPLLGSKLMTTLVQPWKTGTWPLQKDWVSLWICAPVYMRTPDFVASTL